MAKPIEGNVFLTDGVARPTLAACRSLGRRNLAVTCGEETFLNPTFFSRYCHRRVTYPSPRRASLAFVEALLNHLDLHPHECLFPMEQNTLDVVLDHRQAFEQVTRLPFADRETFQLMRDKSKTFEIAAKAGIPFPPTVLPSAPDQVVEETKSLRFPLVIKPRLNRGGQGIRHVHDPGQLAKVYRWVHERYPFPLVQEEIPQGEKYFVCCLFDESARLLAACTLRQIRNYPLADGASTLQESVWRPDLLELTVQLLQAANWYGIASADFMIDPRDGTPMLLEVNPRFWGSLQATTLCEVDFPYLLYRLALGQRFEPVLHYKVGAMCRSLLPHDILHFLTNPQRWHMQPGFFDFFNPQCHFDIISAHDPAPVLGFCLACMRYLLDADMWLSMARTEQVANLLAAVFRRRADGSPKPSETR